MKVMSKRIIALSLITIIMTSIGVGIFIFYTIQEESDYTTPGAPSDVNFDQIIKIVCLGDRGELQGDANYEGAYLAVKTINEAGGIVINDIPYYFGISSVDTDEASDIAIPRNRASRVRREIEYNNPDFAIGGQRLEAVLSYQEYFMDTKKLFLSTGVTHNIFTDNVRNYYDRYKYFFRVMPTNQTSECGQLFAFINYTISYINTIYGAGTISEVGIFAEDLPWTEPITTYLSSYIPFTGAIIPEDCVIRHDFSILIPEDQPNIQFWIDKGVDLLIPILSTQGGIMMMEQYASLQPEFIVVGIDIQSQLNIFWQQSNGACAYETIMQPVFRINKTELTIPVWDTCFAEFGNEPLYTAIGAYDAVYHLSAAIEAVQTLETTEIIAHWETWTRDNPLVGAAGNYAWWPESHELVSGYPYMYSLWTQWQPDGIKTVIPGFTLYNDSLTTGDYNVPPWLDATWSA